jgi:hypothetical protein
VRDQIELQLVAFPQQGIYSFDGGEKLMREAKSRWTFSSPRGLTVASCLPLTRRSRFPRNSIRQWALHQQLSHCPGVLERVAAAAVRDHRLPARVLGGVTARRIRRSSQGLPT